MLELLIVRSGDTYFSFKPEGPQLCGMDKASVFPLSQIEHVRKLCRQRQDNGFPDTEIRKLIITEEPFSEDK